jgi:hypothetical protein
MKRRPGIGPLRLGIEPDPSPFLVFPLRELSLLLISSHCRRISLLVHAGARPVSGSRKLVSALSARSGEHPPLRLRVGLFYVAVSEVTRVVCRLVWSE